MDRTEQVGAAALLALPLATAVLLPNWEVALANPAMRALCAASGLRLAAGDARWCTLVADVLRGGEGGTSWVRCTVGTLVLSVTRLTSSHQGLPCALVTARRSAAAPDPERLRPVFGLTRAEAEIAAHLAAAHSVRDIAARRGRSVATLRRQVRHILAKTQAPDLRSLARMLAELG